MRKNPTYVCGKCSSALSWHGYPTREMAYEECDKSGTHDVIDFNDTDRGWLNWWFTKGRQLARRRR